jgi:DNA-binding IclR family transcriptional regulator
MAAALETLKRDAFDLLLVGMRFDESRALGELMDQYHLSRNTVRQAIEILVHDGFVYQDHGKGNYSIGPLLNIQYRLDTFVEHREFI